jgi:NitT/TauT family transport system substrate-binding protein
LFRSVDLQKEWGRVFGAKPRIPQAGIAALGARTKDTALQDRLMAAYAQSLHWCAANGKTCGEMVAKRIDLLSPEAVTDSLAVSQMDAVPGSSC